LPHPRAPLACRGSPLWKRRYGGENLVRQVSKDSPGKRYGRPTGSAFPGLSRLRTGSIGNSPQRIERATNLLSPEQKTDDLCGLPSTRTSHRQRSSRGGLQDARQDTDVPQWHALVPRRRRTYTGLANLHKVQPMGRGVGKDQKAFQDRMSQRKAVQLRRHPKEKPLDIPTVIWLQRQTTVETPASLRSDPPGKRGPIQSEYQGGILRNNRTLSFGTRGRNRRNTHKSVK
ncbi:MAG: hypothetical protein QG656_529, partial [Candidatus Hydrogenedentes bacterium]|nr:hypothetical protein [Candidatus Hydrogenedentota bacterium]